MISYGQKTLNKKDVRKATWRFIASFLVLTGVSFLAVFFFFKSFSVQNKSMRKDLDTYHDMIGRNNMLRIQADSIYAKLQLLSNDKVANDIFLRNQIIEDLSVGKDIIGGDSLDDLRHYAMLIQNIEPMLTQKNELMKLKTDERAVSRQLAECMGRVGTVKSQIKAMQKKAEPKGSLMRKFR